MKHQSRKQQRLYSDLFKDFNKCGRHFQTNETLLKQQHPELFE